VDIGRPGIGTTFADVETITMEVARVGVEFEPMNPVTYLMIDKNKGRLQEEIKKEKVHSCVMGSKIQDRCGETCGRRSSPWEDRARIRMVPVLKSFPDP
jgi:hypothetical protein